MQRLTFEQWKKRNQDLVDAQVDCDECNGTGVIVCACCGAENTCSDCDGRGKVLVADNGAKISLISLYYKQKAIDEDLIDAISQNKRVHYRDVTRPFVAASLTLRGADLLRSEQAGAENQLAGVASRASS